MPQPREFGNNSHARIPSPDPEVSGFAYPLAKDILKQCGEGLKLYISRKIVFRVHVDFFYTEIQLWMKLEREYQKSGTPKDLVMANRVPRGRHMTRRENARLVGGGALRRESRTKG